MYEFMLIFWVVVVVDTTLLYASNYYRYRNSNASKFLYILSVIIIFLFLGTRFQIGRDFTTYCYIYDDFSFSHYGLNSHFGFEYGNFLITYICRCLDTGPQGYFLLTSLLQVAFFFYMFKNCRSFLPYAFFLFMLCGPYSFLINGVRQGLAIFCFLCAIKPAEQRNKPKLSYFVFWMFMAFLFHNSSIILIPVYVLYNNKILGLFNGKVLISMILFGFMGYVFGVSKYINLDFIFMQDTKYSLYIDSSYFDTTSYEVGLGVVFSVFFYIFPLLFYKQIVRAFPESKIYLVVFSFGVCLKYLLGYNQIILRMSFYLIFALLFVYPYFIYSFKLKKINLRVLSSVLINVWFIVYFLSDYSFFWKNQTQLYPSVFGINLY